MQGSRGASIRPSWKAGGDEVRGDELLARARALGFKGSLVGKAIQTTGKALARLEGRGGQGG